MGEARQPPLSSPWPWTSKLSSEKFFQTDHFVWQLMGAMSNVINSTQWSSPQLATEEWRQVCYLSLYLVCGLHPQVSSVCGLCQLLPGIFVLVALVRTSPKQTKVSSQEHLRAYSKGCRTVPTAQFSPEEVAVLQLDIQDMTKGVTNFFKFNR